MARTIRDTTLGTRADRGRLRPRGKPYYRQIEPGLHLGYRKPRGRKGKPAVAGKWVARHYLGGQAYEVETIGTADDFSDADGVAILSFAQAQEKARERMVRRKHADAGKTGPLTVANAIEDYLTFLETNRKSAIDARARANAFILPALGNIEVESLKTKQLTTWHAKLAHMPPRLRTRKGEEQKYREMGKSDEAKRRRRSSANRVLTILKAALNRAWRAGKCRPTQHGGGLSHSKMLTAHGSTISPSLRVSGSSMPVTPISVSSCRPRCRPARATGNSPGSRLPTSTPTQEQSPSRSRSPASRDMSCLRTKASRYSSSSPPVVPEMSH